MFLFILVCKRIVVGLIKETHDMVLFTCGSLGPKKVPKKEIVLVCMQPLQSIVVKHHFGA